MKKILIWTDLDWSLGAVHREIQAALLQTGWRADLKSWAAHYDVASFQNATRDTYDLMMTLPPCVFPLVHTYGVPRSHIVLVAHAESDIQKLIAVEGVDAFLQYGAYGVTSDVLACSSMALGVTRIPLVLRCGIDTARFARPIQPELTAVGYATIMERYSEHGIEQKRGWLAERCADDAGLPFVKAEGYSVDRMPEFYEGVGALLMPSLQDGSPRPPLEAAAAGRLVIGTPVGHFMRLAYEGLGLLGPLDGQAFRQFATERLRWFRKNPHEYQVTCGLIQEAAQGRDWKHLIGDWVELFESVAP